MRGLSISMFVGAVVSLVMGFYKMFVYENPESYFLDSKNAYVGGDSYNYIINGTYATGYFVLFGSLLIAGLLVELIAIVNRTTKKTKVEKSETALEKYYRDREENENTEQDSDNEVESQQSVQQS